MAGTGIALRDEKKHDIVPGDCLVRFADGPPHYGILRAIASDNLSCGPRVLVAATLGRKVFNLRGNELIKAARDAIATELDRLADLSSTAFVALRDALVAEITEGDHSSAVEPPAPPLSHHPLQRHQFPYRPPLRLSPLLHLYCWSPLLCSAIEQQHFVAWYFLFD